VRRLFMDEEREKLRLSTRGQGETVL